MKTEKIDLYQQITDKIIAQLETGTAVWRKNWSSASSFPINAASRKEYRGINWLMLQCSAFGSNEWMTYKQCANAGGQVRAGSKGTQVVFWSFLPSKTEKKADGTAKMIPFLKAYTVFNREQCENLPEIMPVEREAFCSIERAEAIISAMPKRPQIFHAGGKAFYKPLEDTVTMPAKADFHAPAGYYSVLFHELVHATGHESRLAREGICRTNSFGSDLYSKEELVAEMGAAFLNAHAGIETEHEQSAAYIAGWLKALKDDKKLVMQAASAAQKAADYIMGVSFEVEAA